MVLGRAKGFQSRGSNPPQIYQGAFFAAPAGTRLKKPQTILNRADLHQTIIVVTYMQVTELAIPEVKLIVPKRFEDRRGFFSEIYNARVLADAGITDAFVQDNLSLSTDVGTIRGLHFQTPPHAQAKLVRVSRGRILDVAVDLRRSSPTFGKHVSAELSHDNCAYLYVPIGFAHAFCTLEPDTEVVYKVSNYYAPQADAGVLWSDPDLGIDWPLSHKNAIISKKDSLLPLVKNIAISF